MINQQNLLQSVSFIISNFTNGFDKFNRSNCWYVLGLNISGFGSVRIFRVSGSSGRRIHLLDIVSGSV